MPCATGKQLEFIAHSTPVIISADQDKFKQVLINLVTNAFEAVGEGETITIKLRELGDRLNLLIHNHGKPIPPEVLANLTKPFYTTKSTGNGLGLAIVKRIVEAHGGELQIESSSQIGTQVTVQIPL
jgi:signal transduction histidine kinase